MALLGVKLHCEYIIAEQRDVEIQAIVTASGNLLRLLSLNMVAVDKVEPAVLLNALPQRMVDGLFDLVPAHVRHLQLFTALILQMVSKEVSLAGEYTQTVMATILFAELHHQAETVFKAFGRSLRMALTADERMQGIMPSTKGCL